MERTPLKFLFAVALFSLVFSLCHGQAEVTTGSAGFSLGTGWGVDLGYGKMTVFSNDHLIGWRVTGSFWSPKYDSDVFGAKPAGEEGYFDWLVPTNKTQFQRGLAMGFLYLYDKFGGGVMLDYIVEVSYQNYRSPATGWNWYMGPSRSYSMGITMNLTYRIGEEFDGALFLGTGRGIMLGGAWRF